MYSSAKSSLGRLGPTCQAMTGITLTSKDTRNWGLEEMTSAPNILGTLWSREKSEEGAHHHFKVQSRCLARPSGCPPRAPLLSAGSAFHCAFGMLEPVSGSFPGPSHTTISGQLLCSFQSFYSAPAQTVCMQGGKKPQMNEIIFLFSSQTFSLLARVTGIKQGSSFSIASHLVDIDSHWC